MNEEQRKIVAYAIGRAHHAIEVLELEKARDVSGEIASYRAEIEMLRDETLMNQIFDSWEAVKRGDRGTPGKDLKRKYKRA